MKACGSQPTWCRGLELGVGPHGGSSFVWADEACSEGALKNKEEAIEALVLGSSKGGRSKQAHKSDCPGLVLLDAQFTQYGHLVYPTNLYTKSCNPRAQPNYLLKPS